MKKVAHCRKRQLHTYNTSLWYLFYGLLYDALFQASEFYAYLYDAVILYSHFVVLNNTNPLQLHQNLQRINYTGMFQIIKTKNMFFLFVISLFKSYMSKQYYSKLKKKKYMWFGLRRYLKSGFETRSWRCVSWKYILSSFVVKYFGMWHCYI